MCCRRDHAPCGGRWGGARRLPLPLPPRRAAPRRPAGERRRPRPPLGTCQAGLAAAGRRRGAGGEEEEGEEEGGEEKGAAAAVPAAACPWTGPGEMRPHGGDRRGAVPEATGAAGAGREGTPLGAEGEGPWSRGATPPRGGGRPGPWGESPGARAERSRNPLNRSSLVRGVAGPHAGLRGRGNEGALEALKCLVKPVLICNAEFTFCDRKEGVCPWLALQHRVGCVIPRRLAWGSRSVHSHAGRPGWGCQPSHCLAWAATG